MSVETWHSLSAAPDTKHTQKLPHIVDEPRKTAHSVRGRGPRRRHSASFMCHRVSLQRRRSFWPRVRPWTSQRLLRDAAAGEMQPRLCHLTPSRRAAQLLSPIMSKGQQCGTYFFNGFVCGAALWRRYQFFFLSMAVFCSHLFSSVIITTVFYFNRLHFYRHSLFCIIVLRKSISF